MSYLSFFAIILHIASAAAWFGLSLCLPGLSKLIVVSDAPIAQALVSSGATTIRMMDFFAVLLFALAFVSILAGPGFGGLGWPFHFALALGLILILVQVFMIRKSWAALQKAVARGNSEAARRKVAMSLGIGHLVWFTLLVLMFVSRVIEV